MSRSINLLRRGSRIYLRIPVPPDLRPVVGRWELKRSLGHLAWREARSLALLATHRAHTLFATIRSMQPSPDSATVQRLVRAFYDNLLQRDAHERFAAGRQPDDESVASPFDIKQLLRPLRLEQIQRDFARGKFGRVEPTVQQAIKEGKLDVAVPTGATERPDARYLDLLVGFASAYLEAQKRALERDRGDFSGHPADPGLVGPPTYPAGVVADSSSSASAVPARTTIDPDPLAADADPRRALPPSRLLDDFWLDRTGNTAKTRADYEKSLAVLDEITGSKPISQLTRRDVNRYKETLLRAPKNGTQRYGTSSIFEATQRAEAEAARRRADAARRQQAGEPVLPDELAYDYERISSRTVRNKYLTNVKAFLDWAFAAELIDSDDALKVKVAKDRNPEVARAPFDPEDLRKIFSMPVFTQCRSDTALMKRGLHRCRDHRFWAPLIAALSGIRSNEIGQMGVKDIVQKHGLWFFSVTDVPDPDDPDMEERSVKTANARRLVPIHPELLRIGVLKYRDDMARAGHTRLFPAWHPDKQGYYSGPIGKWFNRTLLGHAGIKTKVKCFHSFRHSFKDLLVDAGIGDESRHMVMGHSPKDTHARYGSREMRQKLAEALMAIQYEGLDLSHISYK